MEGNMNQDPNLTAREGAKANVERSLNHPTTLHHCEQAVSNQRQVLAPLSTTQCHNADRGAGACLYFDPKCTTKLPKSACINDEDEPNYGEDGEDPHDGNGEKASPWHRVKWTDSMVRLLIHVVMLVGEDGTHDSTDANKRKSVVLQKKGKWRYVSHVMNGNGCFVSPQQCEDKFNDLNKRYKRLNDILGKGIACSVVEDPRLLDSMDHLTPKSKSDVRKILSSKQLFYQEICAYHSGAKSLLSSGEFIVPPHLQAGNADQYFLDLSTCRNGADDENGKEDENHENDEQEMTHFVDCHDESTRGFPSGSQKRSFDDITTSSMNYGNVFPPSSPSMLRTQVSQNEAKVVAENQQLICLRMMQLEEQKLFLLTHSLELEKQRFKWEKFNTRKCQELEAQRLENKKLKLGNKRASLQLKQRELEVECKRSKSPLVSMDVVLEMLHSKDQTNYAPREGLT